MKNLERFSFQDFEKNRERKRRNIKKRKEQERREKTTASVRNTKSFRDGERDESESNKIRQFSMLLCSKIFPSTGQIISRT